MARLKIGAILDDAPVKLSVVLPASIHRDLVSYARALARESAQTVEPAQLIAPMLLRFMATDRGFAKWRRATGSTSRGTAGDRDVSGTRSDDNMDR